MEMLQAAPGTRPGKFATPFFRQFTHLLRRKIAITLRNPLAIGMPLVMPMIMGVVVGAMFMGIGDLEGVQGMKSQVSFIFIVLTLLGLGGLNITPIMIDERTFMKYETSEALYAEAASVLASFCIDVPLAFMGSAYNVLIMYMIAGIDSEYLFVTFFWCMLLFLVYDSLFSFVAAVAEDSQQAQAIATPILSIFLLFNGFIVTKPNAPVWLRWIFAISPNAYATQGIIVHIAEGFGDLGEFAIQQYGLEKDQDVRGVVVMVAMIVVLRVLQQVALRLLHNIQK